jgi:predicted alpha/beta-fold hydrolase
MRTFNPILTKSLTRYAAKHKEAFMSHRGNEPVGSHPTSPFPGGKFAAPLTPTSPKDELRRVFDVKELLKVKNLRQFDDMATAQMFGYKDAEAYYRDATTAHRLSSIGIPYLSLNSADDDIISVADIPQESFLKHEYAISAITREGGHVSYSLASDPTGPSWDNAVAIEFFSAVLARRASDSGKVNGGGGGGGGARAM